MYIPDLPTYLVFYFETTHGSSIDTLTMDDDDDDTLSIFSSILLNGIMDFLLLRNSKLVDISKTPPRASQTQNN
jgi:hypothetical protein